MTNIIGEKFDAYVSGQIKVRQENLATAARGNNLLMQQNSRSAWIKLTSAISVLDNKKFGFPEDIGKTYSLFGGTLKNGTVLGGLDAYKEFSFEQGYRPAPGILSFETKNRNRGSVRESTIKLRAYDREQFNLIDILFLRLGYSVFIEFGNSLYYDNNKVFQKANASISLASKLFEAGYSGNPQKLFADIENKRKETSGNYDGIFGRISNFEWNFTSEGYYDISLTIMSYGDVIEALKANSAPDDANNETPTKEETKQEKTKEKLDAAETDSEVIDITKNVDNIGRLSWNIKKALDTNPGEGSENCRILSSTDIFPVLDRDKYYPSYHTYDALKIHNQESGEDYYYIRFGTLLRYLEDKQMLYIDDKGTTTLLYTGIDPEFSPIFKTPYTVTSNPGICIFRTNIKIEGSEQDFDGAVFPDIPEEASFDFKNIPDAGKVLNIYVNLAFLNKLGYQLIDNKGKIAYLDLLNKTLESIQSCLGGRNSLSMKVTEFLYVYVLDEHPIPSKQKEQVTNPDAVLKLYGLNPGVEGSFVRDFGIKTSITNELASTITIGAQANGQIKGEDATAFSKWNQGLVDRILPIKTNERTQTKEQRDKQLEQEAQITEKNKNLATEYLNYLFNLKEYNWDIEKADSFSSILANYLSFTEGAAAVANNSSTGVLGFLPIDLNFTIDGISGIKIYQGFIANSSFLPKNYGETMQFIITGITHTIENNTWLTKIETNLVPASVVAATSNQSFSGISAAKGATATQGSTSGTTPGVYTTPAPGTAPVRLVLRRRKEVYTPGASIPNGTGQTLGVLTLYNPAGRKVADLTTVELPWRGNRNTVSCIPPGRYNFSLSKAGNNPGVGPVLRLDTNGTGRDGVLVHIGTIHKNTHGCILPGLPAQVDNNGDKIPDNKAGTTKAAMDKIISTLYPAGTPASTTYALEVYGIPGKEYYSDNPRLLWPDPTPAPAGIQQPESRREYVRMTGQIKKVLELKDAYNNNSPLLQDLKGTFDDNEARAIDRMKALVNIVKQTIQGNPVPWQNKLPLSKLSKEHQTLFKNQLNALFTAMQSTTSVFKFKYPSTTNSSAYGADGLDMNPDF